MQDGNVNLTISKEIVTPIVDAKIKEAILAALGGTDNLVKIVTDKIINQKVDAKGNVSSYSSENKFSWLDIMVTTQIETAVREELKIQIANSSSVIKEALINQLRTKKGSSMVASALLAGLDKSFESSWRSNIEIKITPLTNN